MHKNKGFTLIELLVVIAIIAILAAIGYPSYQDSVTKSRRADAQAALMGFAQAMERAYTTGGSYTGLAEGGANTGKPTIFSTTSPLDSGDAYYDLRIKSASDSAYIIAAVPINAQAGDGALILKSTGQKGWDVNNSGLSEKGDVDSTELCWQTSC